MSVTLEVDGPKLVMKVHGIDKFLTFKGSIEVPLEHVKSIIRADRDMVKELRTGWKLVGAGIPGVIRAGTWKGKDGMVFWDVRNPDNTVVVELHDESYARLILEVADPDATVAEVQKALAG